MLQVHDIRETRLYQEAKEEGGKRKEFKRKDSHSRGETSHHRETGSPELTRLT